MIAGGVVLAAVVAGCGDSAADSSSPKKYPSLASEVAAAVAIKEETNEIGAEMKWVLGVVATCGRIRSAAGDLSGTDWLDAIDTYAPGVTTEKREEMREYIDADQCMDDLTVEMRQMLREVIDLASEFKDLSPEAERRARDTPSP